MQNAEMLVTNDEISLPYYLLPFYLLRLRNAAAKLSLIKVQNLLHDDKSSLELLRRAVDVAVTDRSKSWRVKVKISTDCDISTTITPVSTPSREIVKLPGGKSTRNLVQFLQQERDARQPPVWDVRLDTVATPESKYTSHKPSVRNMYNEARIRASIDSYEEPHEALLRNANGQITEGSITTVYMWRRRTDTSERYVATPRLSTGCNASSSRRYALSKYLCVEEAVLVSELAEGDEVWLIHASDGFFPGKVPLSRDILPRALATFS